MPLPAAKRFKNRESPVTDIENTRSLMPVRAMKAVMSARSCSRIFIAFPTDHCSSTSLCGRRSLITRKSMMPPRRKRPDVAALIGKLNAGKEPETPAAPKGRAPTPRFLLEAQARRATGAVTKPPAAAVAEVPVAVPAKPERKPRRPDGPATEEDKRLAKNLAELIRRRGISGRELSRRADLSLDAVRNVLSGRSTSPRARTVQALADALEVPLAALYGGEPPPAYVSVSLARTVRVREFAAVQSATLSAGEIVGEWTLPADVIGRRLEGSLYIVTPPAGELPPGILSGDRLLADSDQVRPSASPGVFLCWDGRAPVLAAVRTVLGQPGRISVTIGSGPAAEADEGAITVLARIVARWTAV